MLTTFERCYPQRLPVRSKRDGEGFRCGVLGEDIHTQAMLFGSLSSLRSDARNNRGGVRFAGDAHEIAYGATRRE